MTTLTSTEVWQLENFVKAAIAGADADTQRVIDQYNQSGYVDQFREGWAAGARATAAAIAKVIADVKADAEARRRSADPFVNFADNASQPRWVY